VPWRGKLPQAGVETPAGLREIAERARRLADSILTVGSERRLELANELEARATELEAVELKPPSAT
jgi:hypothetical protein